MYAAFERTERRLPVMAAEQLGRVPLLHLALALAALLLLGTHGVHHRVEMVERRLHPVTTHELVPG